MNVGSVMNTYDMTSLWNNMNQNSSSTVASFPMINSVDSTVKESYDSKNYFGQTTNTDLQDIYKQLEPDYGIPITYNQNGSFSASSSTTSPNLMSLLNSNASNSESKTENLLSQYSTAESSSLKSYYSSILSSNPQNLYNTINSLSASASQNPSVINTTA